VGPAAGNLAKLGGHRAAPVAAARCAERAPAGTRPGTIASYYVIRLDLPDVEADLHGVTGRNIMDHLIAGERSPKVLAQRARARARRKIADLEEALEGAEFFTEQHAAC
jgi:hypothetical protein